MAKTSLQIAILGGAVAAAACLQGSAVAQNERATQEQLVERFDEMKAEAWFKDGRWVTDQALAQSIAEKTDRVIVAYFTRSYAP